jgi:transposase-like protein
MHCTKCLSELIIRNGSVRGKQRYKCKTCCYDFVEFDGRKRPKDATKRALAVILYTSRKRHLISI